MVLVCGGLPLNGKVKEFTPDAMPKPLENGPSGGRILKLLSQPSCPSVKVMGR
jgi:hypothetical protein